MLTYKIIQKPVDVSSGWENLIKESQTGSVFQTRSYVRAWTDSFVKNDQEIFIIEVYEDDKLLAVASFRKRENHLTFLGTDRLESDDLVTDFGDIVIAKNEELRVWSYLLKKIPEMGVKEITFDYIRETSPTYSFFAQKRFSISPILDKDIPDVAPGMLLPGTWEEYLLGLDRKSRHELKRKLRRLESLESRFAVSDDPVHDLPEFFRLHKASTEEKDDFMTEQMEGFFTKATTGLANDSLISLMFMKVNGVNVAATIAFLWKGEYLLYNSGFDRKYNDFSVGFLLKAETVKWAILNKLKKYNFLRGPERYKYELGAKNEGLYRARIIFNF